MGKQLNSFQSLKKMLCDNVMLQEAILMRAKGDGYVLIEEAIFQKGIVNHNGKRYHNAYIAKKVVETRPELQVRFKKVSKNKVKSAKQRAKSSNISNIISAMEKAGLSAGQILNILKKTSSIKT